MEPFSQSSVARIRKSAEVLLLKKNECEGERVETLAVSKGQPQVASSILWNEDMTLIPR